MSRAALAYAAAFAGYDQLSYGITVPSVLEDDGMNTGIGAAGAVGALVGFGMILGFHAFALPAVRAAALTALVPVAHSRMSHGEPPSEIDHEVGVPQQGNTVEQR